MANTNRVDGQISRTLADGRKVVLPFQYRYGKKHYTGDFGDTWTTDKERAFAQKLAAK